MSRLILISFAGFSITGVLLRETAEPSRISSQSTCEPSRYENNNCSVLQSSDFYLQLFVFKWKETLNIYKNGCEYYTEEMCDQIIVSESVMACHVCLLVTSFQIQCCCGLGI